MEPGACLTIENGLHFKEGEKISLSSEITCLGRSWENQKPDVAFSDAHISRRHAAIRFKNGAFELIDLESKHGTEVNGQKLDPGIAISLKHQDRISLARGAAVLLFLAPVDPGETQDIDEYWAETNNLPIVAAGDHLVLDEASREIP